MANERKTEHIVRTHFISYAEEIIIEEQASDNPKINKLLKTASKKGSGAGRPEFIITLNNNPDLIIVIECKADNLKHQSANKDEYSEYAVDGALLYSSYLSKDFDVLSIAVSGETTEKLRVTHFLQLKNEKSAVEIFGNSLLPISNYLDGYIKSPQKYRQDYKTLLTFSKKLNDDLHTNKVPEKDRALLLSCILIALENNAFKKSYSEHNTPKDLADALVQTVYSELKSALISGEKLENLRLQFAFIQTDTSLSTGIDVLKKLIDEIEVNINQFIKTHEYVDVLGQLYIEFLRYANSDKGLGIVLTPPHITELFSDLAQVNKNSIVYDNCVGTGGYLISAMKKMLEDAKGDQAVIKRIKSSQLIGVEYQAHIYALAISNMYIHQDGKTTIMNGSCFDKKIMENVKKLKPSVGFLNPPYKSKKKTDTEELEFVLNNLSVLDYGGTCVAIVPMQCGLAQKGKVLELKKELLNKHTLEAVLSMPNELFVNSKVGVVSIIMVFTAHKPHHITKETYFGYYKDDGFTKRKVQGRYDAFGYWDEIRHKWIKNFLNRKSEVGFSINQKVNAEDEWCAEAYMETDYSQVTSSLFIEEIKKYVAYKVMSA